MLYFKLFLFLLKFWVCFGIVKLGFMVVDGFCLVDFFKMFFYVCEFEVYVFCFVVGEGGDGVFVNRVCGWEIKIRG